MTERPRECYRKKCRKLYNSRVWRKPNIRLCRECTKPVCRDCQMIIINPDILHWESVALNFDPHADTYSTIPISCLSDIPGEVYNYDDYVAFCIRCCLKEKALSLICQDGQRKAEQCL